MNFLKDVFPYLAFCLALCPGIFVNAQSDEGAPISELQRRFLQMEQRALELSQRLSEISGTEPIELIDRNESLEPVELQTDAQQSYDELPGPMVEPLPIPEEPIEEGAPTVYQSEVVHVAPTTQQHKGDYYLMPFIGFSFNSSTTYSFATDSNNFEDDLSGDWGNSVGLSAGKRLDNWLLYGRLAYQHHDFSTNSFQNDSGNQVRASGLEESFSLSVGGGYNVPITTRLSTNGTMGIGFAWRRNTFDAQFNDGTDFIFLTSDNQSSLVFTYDFSMGLEYLFSQNYSARLGYRLIGLTSNESFEGSFQHVIELGVGANF
jgi:opacity protein-like surface antigen